MTKEKFDKSLIDRIDSFQVILDDEVVKYIDYTLREYFLSSEMDDRKEDQIRVLEENLNMSFKEYLTLNPILYTPYDFVRDCYRLCLDLNEQGAIQIFFNMYVLENYFQDVEFNYIYNEEKIVPTMTYDAVDVNGFREYCKNQAVKFRQR